MTGKQFTRILDKMGWSREFAAHNLGVTTQTIYNLTQSDQVDKRTELAILYLKQQQEKGSDE